MAKGCWPGKQFSPLSSADHPEGRELALRGGETRSLIQSPFLLPLFSQREGAKCAGAHAGGTSLGVTRQGMWKWVVEFQKALEQSWPPGHSAALTSCPWLSEQLAPTLWLPCWWTIVGGPNMAPSFSSCCPLARAPPVPGVSPGFRIPAFFWKPVWAYNMVSHHAR